MADDYWLWVLLAVVGGIISNTGVILQKKVVNEIPPKERERRFFRQLIKSPMWILGIILGMFTPAVFVIGANMFVGPALVPGLMNSGLIVLAIGSVKINKERLGKYDYSGIIVMIAAIFFLGMSQLAIKMEDLDYTAPQLLVNITAFTILLFVLWGFFFAFQRHSGKGRANLLIFAAGFMFLLTNFWVAPLSGTILKVFQGTANSYEWLYFIASCILLPGANLIAIANQQTAYKYGQASILNTLQQIPTQVSPPFVYLLIFAMTPPYNYSIPFLLLGIALVLTSTYLLAGRKVAISKIGSKPTAGKKR
nr:hypothetical protein [Candidatus Njordarchaeum guaymaensis]